MKSGCSLVFGVEVAGVSYTEYISSVKASSPIAYLLEAKHTSSPSSSLPSSTPSLSFGFLRLAALGWLDPPAFAHFRYLAFFFKAHSYNAASNVDHLELVCFPILSIVRD